MSTAINYVGALMLTYGYDALMLLLVCSQTLIAAIALRPAKPARIYPLRLINKKRTNTDKK